MNQCGGISFVNIASAPYEAADFVEVEILEKKGEKVPMCFCIGMASSVILACGVYGVSINIILDSAQRALRTWDIISAMIKSNVFGGIIAIVSCAWGVTRGAKGVGESTSSAVVISLVTIFIAHFILSYCFFQGAGDSLKYAMG